MFFCVDFYVDYCCVLTNNSHGIFSSVQNMGIKIKLAKWQGTKGGGGRISSSFSQMHSQKEKCICLIKTIAITSLSVPFDINYLILVVQGMHSWISS